MIINILSFLLFIISMSGFVFFVERKTKIQVEFLPIIVLSIITVILFLGGILNILPLSTMMLFIIGIILFFKEIVISYQLKKMKEKVKKYLTPGIIIFAIFNIIYFFILFNQKLLHYDNFSHWAVIVKSMLMNDSLPNFEDPILTFNSYPPGSALFIYYFNRILGVGEGLSLYAQMIMILASLLTLYSFSSYQVLDKNISKKTRFKKMFLLY